jgi:ABC-type Mn2+/Zn2+ transport system permease subunit
MCKRVAARSGPEETVDWLITSFVDTAFMVRPWRPGTLVSMASAIVGTLMVLRGLAFIGDALAHGVVPGIAPCW